MRFKVNNRRFASERETFSPPTIPFSSSRQAPEAVGNPAEDDARLMAREREGPPTDGDAPAATRATSEREKGEKGRRRARTCR